ncbi:MAG TPA: AMP-binding protein [Sphingobium sp.]|nr:AMP-binding protein [Sphingobium sp.]
MALGDRGDVRWRNIAALARDAARRFGDAPAVIEGDRRISFVELERLMDETARGLYARGFRAGDRAVFWAPNGWRWIVGALAVHAIGGVVVPVNTRYRAGDLAYILAKVAPRAVLLEQGFLGADFLGMLDEALGETPRPLTVLFDDAPDARGICFKDLLAGQAAGDGLDLSGGEGDTPSDIIFTSGTTGSPRGVVTTHAQVLRGFYDFGAQCGLTGGDRYAVVNPFSHSFGYRSGWVMALMFGACVWPLAVLDVPPLLELIERERITVLPGPPTLYQSMLSSPELARRDLSSLRLAWTGAASIPPALITAIRTELGLRDVFTAYALTEATAVATLTRPGDSDERIATTSGCALPDIEVRIANGSTPLAAGESGEIQVRGYNVTPGYLDDPAATAEAVDAEGWLHTGDIGALDEEGYLVVSGRMKEMIIVGGFNVYPAEVENLLLQHPNVAEVAVVGVADERMGEVPLAYLVPRAGCTIDGAEVMAWTKQRIANFKAPRQVRVVDSLPRNALGKVLKHQLG